MKKEQFFNDPAVEAFITWLTEHGPDCRIHLKVKSSRFVPSVIDVQFHGIHKAVDHYMWKSKGMTAGDWAECAQILHALSDALQAAISRQDDVATLKCVRQILEWGGNRSWSRGAWPFLTEIKHIADYLREAQTHLKLDTADTQNLVPIRHMNSMLTKVHALASTDGLPIYDSRVAAAIATLVERWRRDSGLSHEALPAALTFPSAYGGRVVADAFPDAISPGVLTGSRAEAREWASAKIRLGWLMQKALQRADGLFSHLPEPSMRMHAFEGSLIVLGYDVRCLAPGAGPVRAVKPVQQDPQPKRIFTLSGRGSPITYHQTKRGFDVVWGTCRVHFSRELIDSILEAFGGQTSVPLGASRTDPPADSLGDWLNLESGLSSGMASPIAAILVNEGLAKKNTTQAGKTIYLDFQSRKKITDV